MDRVIISILGPDRPGIIAGVSKSLFQMNCNIENVSHTTLQCEFAGIFIASIPSQLTAGSLCDRMNADLAAMGLHVHVKEFEVTPADCAAPGGEPFIITVRGPDRKGLVADITEVIARHQVNITNLQAIFKGGSDPGDNVMIYEVVFHAGLDQKALGSEIRRRSDELGLEISIQHRNIFEAINRI